MIFYGKRSLSHNEFTHIQTAQPLSQYYIEDNRR